VAGIALIIDNEDACENEKADEFVFVDPKTKKPYTDVRYGMRVS